MTVVVHDHAEIASAIRLKRPSTIAEIRNPASFFGECGFEEPADRRLGAMLAFTDVNAPIYGPGSLGAKKVNASRAIGVAGAAD